MALVTKQDIDSYYDNFQNQEVIFNKSVTTILGLQAKFVYFKFKDFQRPCIIYSSSMNRTKVIASIPKEIKDSILEESSISLRFAFTNEEKKNDTIFFFVKCRVNECTVYKAEQNLYVLNFEFISKPPETLIGMLGRLLDAKKNSSTRKEERIIVDKNNFENLGLSTTAVKVIIDNVPRQAIIRDLSFSGIKVLLAGNSKFLKDKKIQLAIHHTEFGNIILSGKSVRADSLPTRKDIVALAIQFEPQTTPLDYTMMINDYIKSHKTTLNKQESDLTTQQN